MSSDKFLSSVHAKIFEYSPVIAERHWATELFVYLLYIVAAAGALFNMSMVVPHALDLHHMFARKYDALLCIPLIGSQLLALCYLLERRNYVMRRQQPVPVSAAQLVMIGFLTMVTFGGIVLYLIPYQFMFWHCDGVLKTHSAAEKWIDVVWYASTASFLVTIVLYSLQRAGLQSDKEQGAAHTFERIIKELVAVTIALLFVKIVCHKVYGVYYGMVCPHAIQENGTTVIELGVCDTLRSHEYQCSPSRNLTDTAQFWYTLDKNLARPFTLALGAELLPLLFCLHRATSSHHHMKVRPEAPVARFVFPKQSTTLVMSVYRPLAAAPLPLAVLIVAYRMYVTGVDVEKPMPNQLHYRAELEAAHSVLALLLTAIYAIVYGRVFWKEPRKYMLPKRWLWWRRPLRKTYRTLHVEHAMFDSMLLLSTATLKTLLTCGNTALCAATGTCGVANVAEVLQLAAMLLQWAVLRNMLILNDSELNGFPLNTARQFRSFGLGPTMALTGAGVSFLTFIEQFVEYLAVKMALAQAAGRQPVSFELLVAVLMNETMHWGVMLYYFTAGVCWLELIHRYHVMGAFSIGEPFETKSRRGMSYQPQML